MDLQNIENTLKKMGIVLERVVNKLDELDKRISQIEKKIENNEKTFSSKDFKTDAQTEQNPISNKGVLGNNFLGSMLGTMAGMGLYNLLFNHSITPVEFGESLGMNQNEINEVLENDFDEIDTKLDDIDNKIDELDEKIDQLEQENIMNNDYFENYEEDIGDSDFESGFDDFDGFDDI